MLVALLSTNLWSDCSGHKMCIFPLLLFERSPFLCSSSFPFFDPFYDNEAFPKNAKMLELIGLFSFLDKRLPCKILIVLLKEGNGMQK